MTQEEAVAGALRHSTGNRKEIEVSRSAECFSCCAIFSTKEIAEWKDEWTAPERQNRVPRWSAKCPRCGKPSVIGDASGFLSDQAYTVLINHIMQERNAQYP